VVHARPHAPPPRWSKKTDALVRYVAQRCRPGLQSELGRWLEGSPRFRDFVALNQDKVRKKLNAQDDEDTRLDVRAELLVAYALLADRRFEVAFEASGSGQRGPDLSITFRANTHFNIEITRPRLAAAGDAPEPRLASVIHGKLRQLPAGVPNTLLIAAPGLAPTDDTLPAATRPLRQRPDARWPRLSGIWLLDEQPDPRRAVYWPNPEAAHPLPREALAAANACLTGP
jgi:hypothetical protein